LRASLRRRTTISDRTREKKHERGNRTVRIFGIGCTLKREPHENGFAARE